MFNIDAAVESILSPLVIAAAAEGAKREEVKGYNEQITAGILAGYCETVVVIAAAHAAGTWTTGKQKGGAPSASARLKAALIEGAKKRNVNEARAKRLVETAAAVLFRKDARIADVVEAAHDAGAVYDAFQANKIKREADLLRHVGAVKKADKVAALVKAFKELSPAEQARFTATLAAGDKPTLRIAA
ncbi:hypothetical protein [Planktothrix phage Pra-JY27]|nr:hypothetical protein [Planktothrix phage Pag-Yong1]WEV89279.1 hypothetical protein [Synechococcus phage MinM2]